MKPQLKPLIGGSSVEFYPRGDAEDRIRQTIIRSYQDWVIRLYSRIRFHIINIRFLEMMEQHLPTQCKVLDVGCGFGLFANYFALRDPSRQIVGVDLNAKRIAEAQQVAQALQIPNVQFLVGDANSYEFEHSPFDVVITLDLLHHLDRAGAERLIGSVYRHLNEGGIYIVKEVNAQPFWKMWFTYLLDRLMDFRRPVHYRHVKVWREVLLGVGFRQVKIYYLDDYLPYPHILLICEK